MTERYAYLDCAATTPMRPGSVAAMMPFLTERYANPSGGHRMAREARAAIDDARELAAELLGFSPHDIVFTGGGTEADNLIIGGVLARRGGVAVCPASEHHAVLHPVEASGGRVVAVDHQGFVDEAALIEALDEQVTIVSVMSANNESGVVQDLARVRELVNRHAPNAVLHTDAVQAVSWLDVQHTAHADALSLSAHKFGGPKGVGLLAVRSHVDLGAQILGGGQEGDRRSGTHNTGGIVAMVEALRLTVEHRAEEVRRIGAERNRLADGLLAAIPGSSETTSRDHRTAGLCQMVFEGIESEALLVLLEEAGVMASAASSCASGAMDPSHVLSAMGFEREVSASSLRLSLGWCTESWEIDRALAVIPEAVEQLRRPVRRAAHIGVSTP